MTENVSKLKDKDVQDLTNSLYLIKGLYVQMTSERDHLTDTASKIVNATKQFQAYLEKFKDQKEKIPILIQDTLSAEFDNIAKKIVDRTYEQITIQTGKTLNTLNDSISRANEKLVNYRRKERLFSKWFLAFMFMAAIVGGLSGGALIRYYYPAINKEILMKIHNGEVLDNLVSRLDEKGLKQLKVLLKQVRQ